MSQRFVQCPLGQLFCHPSGHEQLPVLSPPALLCLCLSVRGRHDTGSSRGTSWKSASPDPGTRQTVPRTSTEPGPACPPLSPSVREEPPSFPAPDSCRAEEPFPDCDSRSSWFRALSRGTAWGPRFLLDVVYLLHGHACPHRLHYTLGRSTHLFLGWRFGGRKAHGPVPVPDSALYSCQQTTESH